MSKKAPYPVQSTLIGLGTMALGAATAIVPHYVVPEDFPTIPYIATSVASATIGLYELALGASMVLGDISLYRRIKESSKKSEESNLERIANQ